MTDYGKIIREFTGIETKDLYPPSNTARPESIIMKSSINSNWEYCKRKFEEINVDNLAKPKPGDAVRYTNHPHWGYGKQEFEDLEKGSQINAPTHYNLNYKGIECIQAIEASMSPEAFAGALKANVIKYLWRYKYKAKPIEDLEKAQWYLNKLIEVEKANV